jgi:hypothetical protein
MGSVESGGGRRWYETMVGTWIHSLGSALEETTIEKNAQGCCCNCRRGPCHWLQSEARVAESVQIGGRGRGTRQTPSRRQDCCGAWQNLSRQLQSTARAASSFRI